MGSLYERSVYKFNKPCLKCPIVVLKLHFRVNNAFLSHFPALRSLKLLTVAHICANINGFLGKY